MYFINCGTLSNSFPAVKRHEKRPNMMPEQEESARERALCQLTECF